MAQITADVSEVEAVRKAARPLGGSASDFDPLLEAVGEARRFPTWMWRNTDGVDLVGWLRAHDERKGESAAGFYGLDLYSLHAPRRLS
jgi:erythromycin esterase-like protein